MHSTVYNFQKYLSSNKKEDYLGNTIHLCYIDIYFKSYIDNGGKLYLKRHF